jgi:hypothetical protein
MNNIGTSMDSSDSSMRLSPSSRLIAKIVPNFLQRAFSDPSLEHLYQSYRVKQKRIDIICFLYCTLAFEMYIVISTINEFWQGTPNVKITLPVFLAVLSLVNLTLIGILTSNINQNSVKVSIKYYILL